MRIIYFLYFLPSAEVTRAGGLHYALLRRFRHGPPACPRVVEFGYSLEPRNPGD